MRSATLACAAVALLALAGCQTYSMPTYVGDTDTLLTLRTLKGKTVQLGAFESGLKDNLQIACRGMGPIKPLGGQTFSGYVHDAFQLELRGAGLLASGSPTVLTGRLDSLEFGWGLPGQGDAKWAMTVTLSSSNGTSMRVAHTTSFHGDMNAVTFCQNAPVQFMKNVQALVKKVVTSPEFAGLLD